MNIEHLTDKNKIYKTLFVDLREYYPKKIQYHHIINVYDVSIFTSFYKVSVEIVKYTEYGVRRENDVFSISKDKMSQIIRCSKLKKLNNEC